MHGYMRRKRRGLFRWGWKTRYFALYRDSALYQFKDADACTRFFAASGGGGDDDEGASAAAAARPEACLLYTSDAADE